MTKAIQNTRWTIYEGCDDELQLDYVDGNGVPQDTSSVTEVEVYIAPQRGEDAVIAKRLSDNELVAFGDGWALPVSIADTDGLGTTGAPVGEAGRGETGSYWMQVFVTDDEGRNCRSEGPVSILRSSRSPA